MADKYSKTDAAKDTNSSTSKVAKAWHDAKTDSGVRNARDGKRGDQETATKRNQAESQAAESKYGLRK